MKKQLFLVMCIVSMTTITAANTETVKFHEANVNNKISFSTPNMVQPQTEKQTIQAKYNRTSFPAGCATGVICSNTLEEEMDKVLMVKPQITFMAQAETNHDNITISNTNEPYLASQNIH